MATTLIDLRLKLTLICLFFFLVIGNLYAQEKTITVQDALNIAMQNNPQLNRIIDEVRIYESHTGTAWGVDSPEIFYFQEGLDGSTFLEQRWGVSQSFTFPLKGYYQNRKARADLTAIEMEVESIRKSIRVSVKKAYTELAYAIKYIELTEREVDLAEDLRDIAQTRFDVGESSELDLIQSDIRLSQAQNDLLQAIEKKHTSRYALFRIIGLDTEDQQYDISYPDSLVYFDAEINQNLVMNGLYDTPEIQTAKLLAESAQQNIKVTKSGYLPDLRIDYYQQDFGDGFRFKGFEIGVKIPLWFVLNERNRVIRANAAYRQAEWDVTEKALKVKEMAENAWHSYETSRENIHSYRDFIQRRSENLLELTQEGYRMGELDLLRVLEAQRTYLEGQHQYYQALRNYYLKLIELEQYMPYEFVFNQ